MTGIEQSLLIPKDTPFPFPEGIVKFLSHLPQGPSSWLITSIHIPSPFLIASPDAPPLCPAWKRVLMAGDSILEGPLNG